MFSPILVKNAYVFEHVFLLFKILVKKCIFTSFLGNNAQQRRSYCKNLFHILIAIVKEGLFWEDCRRMLFLLYFSLVLWICIISKHITQFEKNRKLKKIIFVDINSAWCTFTFSKKIKESVDGLFQDPTTLTACHFSRLLG